jgi:hypothetical protein
MESPRGRRQILSPITDVDDEVGAELVVVDVELLDVEIVDVVVVAVGRRYSCVS